MTIKVEISQPFHTGDHGMTERAVSVRHGKEEPAGCRVRFNRTGAYTVLSPTLPEGCTPAQVEADQTVQKIVHALDRMGEKKLLAALGVGQ